MKQKVTILLMLLTCYTTTWAQTITPSVIAASGNYGSAGSIVVSYTVGEQAAVTTIGSISGFHITQGFHQPEEFATVEIKGINSLPLQFLLFPLPATKTIWVQYNTSETGVAKYIITDIFGKTISTQIQADCASGVNTFSLDVVGLPSANYILTIQYSSSSKTIFSDTKQFSINQ